MLYISKMMQSFQGSYIMEFLHANFVHMKVQKENHQMPKTGLTLDQIMHLKINGWESKRR